MLTFTEGVHTTTNPKGTGWANQANGVATLTNVPIGQEVVTADAPGLHGVTSVTVTENQSFSVTIQMSPT